jgi:hypothetical protein
MSTYFNVVARSLCNMGRRNLTVGSLEDENLFLCAGKRIRRQQIACQFPLEHLKSLADRSKEEVQ